MSIKDLFDQAKQHPYLVSLALFACLVVGGVAAVAYMTVSDARLDMREEKIGVLDERLRLQEDTSKRQRHINKLVQEQIGSLRKGFDALPPAVTGVRTVLTDAERSGAMQKTTRLRLHASLQSVEQQLVVLQAAITNSEALSKSLDVLVSGALAEEGTRYAEAADYYRKAANAGIVDAQVRLARLYFEGKGVEKNVDLATQLYERSALQGNLTAKDELVKFYYSGDGAQQNTVRAAAILSIEPRSETQKVTLQSMSKELDAKEQTEFIALVKSLQQAQIAIVKNGSPLGELPK